MDVDELKRISELACELGIGFSVLEGIEEEIMNVLDADGPGTWKEMGEEEYNELDKEIVVSFDHPKREGRGRELLKRKGRYWISNDDPDCDIRCIQKLKTNDRKTATKIAELEDLVFKAKPKHDA